MANAQQHYRIKSDFSIKENLPDGTSNLTMGTVYFDKNNKKIVYSISFPTKTLQVLTDSFFYELKANKLSEKKKATNLLQFSIFNLALSSNLSNYGLNTNGIFKLTDVSKEDSLVISTWEPSTAKLKELTGKVLISQKRRLLYGLVFFDNKNTVLSKQFFTEYMNVKGLNFPSQITQVNYINGKEYYKVTTYKNIVVNATNENEIYNFNISTY
ncbi:hypothetical protein LBMAG25_14500 [Bacteroidota bacterium]|nr:hypothetical protein LBMAG25_14500 [Bacteroidota bacterium]